jgi:MFS family permease
MAPPPPVGRERSGLLDPQRPFRPDRFPVFYGWVIAVAATLGVLMSLPGQTMGVSVFTERLIDHLGLRRTTISLAYLIGTLLSGFLVPSMGRALDRVGIRAGAMLAAFGMALALVLLATSGAIVDLLRSTFGIADPFLPGMVVVTVGFFLLRFFGQGLLTLSSRNMIAKWFDRLRGRVNALSGIFVSLGFSTAPWFLEELIRAAGWRGAWYGLAVASGIGFVLIAWIFFRDNPEECGLEMDGGRGGETEGGGNPDNRIVRAFTRAEAVRTLPYWLFNLSLAYQAFFITGYTFHVLSIGENLGIGREMILNLFLPGGVLAIMVSLFAGWMIDRTRLKYVLTFFATGMVLFPTALLLAPAAAALPLLVVGFAIGNGCFTPLIGTVWARYFGREHLGAISGLNMSTIVISSALGPLFFSLSVDWTGSYRAAIAVCLAMALLLFVGSWRADNPQRKLWEKKA